MADENRNARRLRRQPEIRMQFRTKCWSVPKVLTLVFSRQRHPRATRAESTPSLLKMLEALALDGRGESTVFATAKPGRPRVAALLKRRARPFP